MEDGYLVFVAVLAARFLSQGVRCEGQVMG